MADTWTFSIKDDVSKTSASMAMRLTQLDKTASDLFKRSYGNFKQFESNLKKAGVDTVDAKIITEKYRKELTATRKEMLGLGDDARRTSRSLGEITKGALRSIGEKAMNVPGMLVSGAVGAVTTIGEKVFDVGKNLVTSVIEAAQFKQNAISGLEYMLGTRKEAEQIFADAQKLAQDTPLDTDKVITGIKQLVTAGFSGKDSMMLFKAVADQASKFADNEGMQENVISAFSRVKGRGVANAEDLDSFRKAGFRVEGIIQELLDKQNLKPLFEKIKIPGLAGGKTRYVDQKDADKEAIQKQVGEVLGQGRISSTTFLNAAVASLERGKGDIGEFAGKMGSKSLTGTISNFKSSFGDLLKSTNIDEWEGVKKFQDFLTRISNMMKGDVGQGLLSTVKKLIDAVLGGLANIKDSDIKGFVETLGRIGERVVEVVKEAWGWIDKLVHAQPGEFLNNIKEVLIDVGKLIGQGILAGVKGAVVAGAKDAMLSKVGQVGGVDYFGKYGFSKGTLEETAAKRGMGLQEFLPQFAAARSEFQKTSGVGDWLLGGTVGQADKIANMMSSVGVDAAKGLEQGARTELDSHSPSRTMARVGEDAARGLVMGTEKGVAASPGRAIGAIHVNVNVGSMSGMGDPTQAANTIADITVERIMLAVMERKALEA